MPEVRLLDPNRVDFRPLADKINKMKTQSYTNNRKADFFFEDSNKWKENAENTLMNTNVLDQEVLREVKYVNEVIGQIQILATNSDLQGSGPKIAHAIKQAQANLATIKSFLPVEARDKFVDSISEANVLHSEMIVYALPLNDITNATKRVTDQLNILDTKLNDLHNLTQQVDEIARNVELLVFQNKKATDPMMIDTIKNSTESSMGNILLGEQLNQEGNQAADELDQNYSELSEYKSNISKIIFISIVVEYCVSKELEEKIKFIRKSTIQFL